MARLTQVYNSQDENYVNIGRRNLPLAPEDKLRMIMDLNSKGLCIDSPQIRGRELEEFSRKFKLLTNEELHVSLEIDSSEFIGVLNQCVQCVGCRRRVERLFYQLTLSGYPTLDPLVLRSNSTLTVTEDKMKTPQALGTLLYRHHEVLNNLLDNKLRNKTRCVLHSLDAFRAKPFSETWREVWSAMKNNCRDELTVIETKDLQDVLENYLKKHKFCTGCRTKIEKAYKILVGEIQSKEKGYVAALYANIRKCVSDKHIHVSTNKIDFLDTLIKRAEPEVNGSYSKLRERHAKTLEIAQEEVLTCVGMIMYERLRRIYVNLREEERACQVLAAVAVHALCRSFDTYVEKKQGISNLELLYKEISRAEKAKELKREQKKLKKKKKKNEKKNSYRICEQQNTQIATDDDEDEENDEAVDIYDDADADDDDDDDDDDTNGNVDYIDVNASDGKNGIKNLITKPKLNVMITAPPPPTDESCRGLAKVQSKQQQQQAQLKSQKQQISKKKNKQKTPTTVGGGGTTKKTKQQQSKQQQSNKRSSSCSSNDNPKMLSSPITVSSGGDSSNVREKCGDCLASTTDCPCDVRDSGYGSEPTSHPNSRTSSVLSSPEGSEVSCSDGFCNHEPGVHELDDEHTSQQCGGDVGNDANDPSVCHQQPMNTLSLLQMLDDFDDYYEDEENCYIPQEVVLEYQSHHEKVQQQRQQLRATLRENFERMCQQHGVTTTSNCH